MIETIIVQAIEAIDGLSDKVFPLGVPEGTALPCIAYISHGTTEDVCLSGWMGSYTTEMEIHVVHESYKAMKVLAADITDAIKKISGPAIIIKEESPESFEQEVKAYHKIINIKIMH